MAVPMKHPALVALVIMILYAGNAGICTSARLLSETLVSVPATINETSIANLPPADLLNSADLSALAGDHMNITDLTALFAGSQPNITELSALASAEHLNVTDLSALAGSLPNNTGSSPNNTASAPAAADFSSVAFPNITLPDLSMGSMDLPEFSFPPMSAPGEIIPMSNFTIFGQQVSLPSFLDISSYFNNDKS